MRLWGIIVLVSLAACEDYDGDSYLDSEDCNDSNPRVYPGADEVCDRFDNDCDGVIDEPDALDALTWYVDKDGDGFGTGVGEVGCFPPGLSWVPVNGDCDDQNPWLNPDIVEVCDGLDNDCNGQVDGDDAWSGATWYPDRDGDHYGVSGSVGVNCPTDDLGWAVEVGDCDDTQAQIHPGATEWCDGLDTDCDGRIDPPGLAAFTSDEGVRTDLTAAMGIAAAVTIDAPGELELCGGSYQGNLEIQAEGEVRVRGVSASNWTGRVSWPSGRGTLSLERVALSFASALGDGAIIELGQANLVLVDTAFSQLYGDAVWLGSGDLSVVGFNGSNVAGRVFELDQGSASLVDVALHSVQGVVTVHQGDLTVADSSFKHANGIEPAVFVGGDFTSTRSAYSYLRATGDGGAVWVGGEASLGGDDYRYNEADRGGALYVLGALSFYDTTFENNTSDADGGAIWAADSVLGQRSSFVNNGAGGNGGVFYGQGEIKLDSVTLRGNLADGHGGVVYADGSDVRCVSCEGIGNEANRGGTFFMNGGALRTVSNTSLWGEATDGGVVALDAASWSDSSGDFAVGSVTRHGGLIWCDGGSMALQQTELSQASAEGKGGLLYAKDCAVDLDAVALDDGEAVSGGALYLDGGSLTDEDGVWETGSASSFGGALYADGSTLSLENTAIDSCDATSGGAIYLDGADGSFTTVFLSDNVATEHGGGLYMAGSSVLDWASPRLTGGEAERGGGVYLAGGTLSLTGSSLSTWLGVLNNTASEEGGGVYLAADSAASPVSLELDLVDFGTESLSTANSPDALYIEGVGAQSMGNDVTASCALDVCE